MTQQIISHNALYLERIALIGKNKQFKYACDSVLSQWEMTRI